MVVLSRKMSEDVPQLRPDGETDLFDDIPGESVRPAALDDPPPSMLLSIWDSPWLTKTFVENPEKKIVKAVYCWHCCQYKNGHHNPQKMEAHVLGIRGSTSINQCTGNISEAWMQLYREVWNRKQEKKRARAAKHLQFASSVLASQDAVANQLPTQQSARDGGTLRTAFLPPMPHVATRPHSATDSLSSLSNDFARQQSTEPDSPGARSRLGRLQPHQQTRSLVCDLLLVHHGSFGGNRSTLLLQARRDWGC